MVRLASGVALAAAALAAILLLPIAALRVVACVVAALAAYEYLEIAGVPLRAVVLAVALCWVSSGPAAPSAYDRGPWSELCHRRVSTLATNSH
jgi:hypothetical protein